MTADWVARAEKALEPYQWRWLAADMLVRRVLAAGDAVCGSTAITPVPRHDSRVGELTSALAAIEWRALTLGALCHLLAEMLADWYVREHCLDLELAWLLEQDA